MSNAGPASSEHSAVGAWQDRLAGFASRRMLLLVPFAFLAILFYYPLVNMLSASFEGGGFTQYEDVLNNAVFREAAIRTLWVSALCTVLSLVLAYPLAYEVTRPPTRARAILLAMVLVSFTISVLIRAYSWLVILEPTGVLSDVLLTLGVVTDPLQIQQKTGAVVVGMVHFLIPYMVLILIPALRAIDPDLIRAARAAGASRSKTVTRVVLPLTASAIVGGCLLTFILGIGFFIMPAVLGGPAVPFTSNLISDQVGLLQNFGVAAAMGALLSVVVVAIYAVMIRFLEPAAAIGGERR
jgi:ABC-type spermidine/putrescine transport system permease subunit I